MFKATAGFAVLVMLTISLAQAQSVGTAFTYQGFVQVGPSAANGVYDLEFTVWDNATTGALQGSQNLEDVSVTNGVFSVDLDMGYIFSGQALWMQIGIRPGASLDPYTILSPRQPLTAVPYAQSLRPGAVVSRDALGPVMTLINGEPGIMVALYRSGLDIFTSDGTGINAYAGSGIGVFALHAANGTNPAILAKTNSTSSNANAIVGEVTSTTPGGSSAGVRGINNGTGGNGIGVWGSHDGTGWGVYGTAVNGRGVYGRLTATTGGGAGVYGNTSSAEAYAGYFTNSSINPDGVGLYVRGSSNTAADIILGGTASADDGRILSDPTLPSSDIWLISNDAVVIQLDANGDGEDADFEIRDKDNNIIFNVDESSILTMAPPGSGNTFAVWASEAGNDGAQMALRNLASQDRILLDAEEGPGGRAALRMYHPNGTQVVELITSELGGNADGAQLTLRNDAGVATIILDAEFNDGGAGRITTQHLQITGGSDLSEHFTIRPNAEAAPEPGMVVCIDPGHTGELIVSSQPYDRTVAGIVSGAGGVHTGLMMGQAGTPEADGAHAVALTGRVYVWADAAPGAIQPGDLLTTAATPGHAMKVADHARAQGAIIGKAMSRLDEGRGLVLVLVSLH